MSKQPGAQSWLAEKSRENWTSEGSRNHVPTHLRKQSSTRLGYNCVSSWTSVREGIKERETNLDFQVWSVHHGSGRADTDSTALKQKSERRKIWFGSWVSKGRRRKLKRHAVLASVAWGGCSIKLEKEGRSCTPYHGEEESRPRGELGPELRWERSKQRRWQLLTDSLRCRKPDVRSRGWWRLNGNVLKVLWKGDIGAKEFFFPCGSRSQSCRMGFTFVDSRQARSGGIGISTERDFCARKGPENKFMGQKNIQVLWLVWAKAQLRILKLSISGLLY